MTTSSWTGRSASPDDKLDQALMLFHQFGKDLTWIRSLATRLERSDPSPRLKEKASAIRSLSEEMGRAVRRFLDAEPTDRRAPLGTIIDEALRVVLRTGLGCRVTTTVDAGLSAVAVDERIGAVLTNLVENATAASLLDRPIRLEASCCGGDLRIRVSDEGLGMDRPTLERCCSRGFTTKADDGGAGIGLFASQRLVASMGGTLVLESIAGQGTTAALRVPLEPSGPPSP